MVNPTHDAAKLRKEAGAYIARLRMNRNLTQLELAKLISLDYYTNVSGVERGQASVPSYQLKMWALALGVERREFAKKLLRFYNPHTFDALYGDHKKA